MHTSPKRHMARLLVAGLFSACLTTLAHAQLYPPGGVPGGGYQQGGGPADAASLLVRIDRLERELRSMTGQMEQMQFQNRRLEEQLQRFQQDIDMRLQDSGSGGGARSAPQRRGDAGDVARPPVASSPTVAGTATPRGRGDAFDPAQSPGAPGAPRVLGRADTLSGPLGNDLDQDPNAPLDLLGRRGGGNAVVAPLAEPRQQASLPVDPAPGPAPPSGPRAEYDIALAAVRANQLDTAETGLKDFLQRYPTSQLAASATYNLGDVYARRGRHREAAESFLKVSTDFSKATQAPQSLVRLGQSLERLGAKEQACAAWSEVGRKYPAATQAKASAERDMKRAAC